MTLRINGLHIISISDCLSAPVVVGEVTPSTLLMYGMYVHCMLMVVLQFCSLFCILHCCTVHSSFGRFAWVCRWCTMHHWMRSEKKKKKKKTSSMPSCLSRQELVMQRTAVTGEVVKFTATPGSGTDRQDTTILVQSWAATIKCNCQTVSGLLATA